MFHGLKMLGVGAGLMYFLDPDRGPRRRALVRDQFDGAMHDLQDGIEVAWRDLGNRASGTYHEAAARLTEGEVEDRVLVERVRAQLGRAVSHPRAIEVSAHGGRVVVGGPILEREVERLLGTVASVRGVRGVEDRLQVFREPGSHPSLQGGRALSDQDNWGWSSNLSPATRLVLGAAGGVMLLGGVRRGGLLGLAKGVAGSVLLARSLADDSAGDLAKGGLAGRRIEVRKSIRIGAPVSEVFSAWSDYANFPHFLSQVREVRPLGGGRSRWVVRGPAGVDVTWDAVETERVTDEVLAWCSEPGSMVPNEGEIHFEPADDGGTVAHVRLAYEPPAGALGHGVARLLGVDPKRQLDEDLVRMKQFLETGIAPRDAARPAPSIDEGQPARSGGDAASSQP